MFQISPIILSWYVWTGFSSDDIIELRAKKCLEISSAYENAQL
jgi:hypothetical protein